MSGPVQAVTGRLVADVEKRFASGVSVGATFEAPTAGACVTALFGASASGKTTVLRCLAGLERPQAGTIAFDGSTWFDAMEGLFLAPQRRDVGYMFQDYALFPHLNALRNVEFGLVGSARAGRAAQVLERMGLGGVENRYPRELSGGQQQRLALARTIARRPRLLLLDEPLSALDTPTRTELRRELRSILRELGSATVIVTHDPMEAIALCDRAVVMHGGVVVQTGSVQEVFSRPVNAQVARIVGVETVTRGLVELVHEGLATVRVDRAVIYAMDSGGLVPGVQVDLCIRAEDVLLERSPPDLTSARNRLACRVTGLVHEGATVRVELDCGFPLTALVTRRGSQELSLSPGEQVTALVKATAIHLIARGPGG